MPNLNQMDQAAANTGGSHTVKRPAKGIRRPTVRLNETALFHAWKA
ncbi:MAG: hypothetical protein V2J26_11580 [Pacificimonas sp.]|jgi:hypothetical protein|nr:hypothetical protein [Pacificimonas sp.]